MASPSEYGAESRLTPAPWTLLRWVEPHPLLEDPGAARRRHRRELRRRSKSENPVVLFPNAVDHALFPGSKEPGAEIARPAPLEQTLLIPRHACRAYCRP